MKYLQILNAALAAVGATMTVVLGVVCFIYLLYLHDVPRLQREMPLLLSSVASFAALGGVAALAFVGHRRGRVWAWLAEAALMISVASVVALVWFIKA